MRGVRKSEAAMRAATTNATVVKNPKVFWMRVRELYMAGDYCMGASSYRGIGRVASWEGGWREERW